jgi:hypothetical protein
VSVLLTDDWEVPVRHIHVVYTKLTDAEAQEAHRGICDSYNVLPYVARALKPKTTTIKVEADMIHDMKDCSYLVYEVPNE